MRHSAMSAARRIARLASEGAAWDVVFASSMLPLAELRGLSPEIARVPGVLYFHENQLTYPKRGPGIKDPYRDAHYAYTEFVSACAADALWFNSRFHHDDWFAALPVFLRRFPDYPELDQVAEIQGRASVQWPGVEQDKAGRMGLDVDRPRTITWAARWEHDKNPECLFEALRLLADAEPCSNWRVNVLGERFREEPACFERGARDLGDRLGEWGFLSRARYLETLEQSDVFVSTADHEFFGLSVVEAMLAGARPLLPRRLSYPELVDSNERYLYDGTAAGLARALRRLFDEARCSSGSQDERTAQEVIALAQRFRWSQRVGTLDDALERVARSSSTPRQRTG